MSADLKPLRRAEARTVCGRDSIIAAQQMMTESAQELFGHPMFRSSFETIEQAIITDDDGMALSLGGDDWANTVGVVGVFTETSHPGL